MCPWLSYSSVLCVHACSCKCRENKRKKKKSFIHILNDQISIRNDFVHTLNNRNQIESSELITTTTKSDAGWGVVLFSFRCKIQFTRSLSTERVLVFIILIRKSIWMHLELVYKWEMRNENTSINRTFYGTYWEKLLRYKPSWLSQQHIYISYLPLLIATNILKLHRWYLSAHTYAWNGWNQSFKRSMDASHCSN